MVLFYYEYILAFNDLNYVHREFKGKEENSMGTVRHGLPLYIAQHIFLHEKVETFSNLRFASLLPLLNFNLLDDFLQLGLNFLFQKFLFLDEICHRLNSGIGGVLARPCETL